MSLLQVDHLSYSYDGATDVLRDVCFEVGRGEIVGLIGPNGSGKSTLIRNIFDLVQLQAGSLTVGGYRHTSSQAKSCGIYLSSNDYLPQFLTGNEYLETLARLYDQEIDPAECQQLFQRFAMAGRADDLIEDYSHGMRKKTQIISALLLDRPLTVIDETLNGIDVEAQHLCEQDFARLRDRDGSILLCTHDFSLLERVADRIVFLDLGSVIVDAPVAEIVAQHGTLANLVFGHLDSEARHQR